MLKLHTRGSFYARLAISVHIKPPTPNHCYTQRKPGQPADDADHPLCPRISTLIMNHRRHRKTFLIFCWKTSALTCNCTLPGRQYPYLKTTILPCDPTTISGSPSDPRSVFPSVACPKNLNPAFTCSPMIFWNNRDLSTAAFCQVPNIRTIIDRYTRMKSRFPC